MTGTAVTPPRMMPPRRQSPIASAPFHELRQDHKSATWLAFHRYRDGILLRFPDFADFLITRNGSSATCWPVPEIDDAIVQHLYLNQVMPMMATAGGRPAFHGGAVQIPACREAVSDRPGAIAFLGPSGRGKSTLTASFAMVGGRFLTDDALVIVSGDAGVIAHPSHPSIRVWGDSRTALVGDVAALGPAVSFTEKERLLATENLPHCAEPQRILAAFFLGDAETDRAVLKPLAGAATVACWMENLFLLDFEDRARTLRNLDAVTAIARGVPSFALA